jgi:hypothetical protein
MTSRHTEQWLQNRRFGLVIDAGSSGSRIHIYSWIHSEHLRDTIPPHEFFGALPTIEPGVESGSLFSSDWTKKTEPGTVPALVVRCTNPAESTHFPLHPNKEYENEYE